MKIPPATQFATLNFMTPVRHLRYLLTGDIIHPTAISRRLAVPRLHWCEQALGHMLLRKTAHFYIRLGLCIVRCTLFMGRGQAPLLAYSGLQMLWCLQNSLPLLSPQKVRVWKTLYTLKLHFHPSFFDTLFLLLSLGAVISLRLQMDFKFFYLSDYRNISLQVW